MGRLWKGKLSENNVPLSLPDPSSQQYPLTPLNVLDLFLTAFCIITLLLVFLNPCGASSKRKPSHVSLERNHEPSSQAKKSSTPFSSSCETPSSSGASARSYGGKFYALLTDIVLIVLQIRPLTLSPATAHRPHPGARGGV